MSMVGFHMGLHKLPLFQSNLFSLISVLFSFILSVMTGTKNARRFSANFYGEGVEAMTQLRYFLIFTLIVFFLIIENRKHTNLVFQSGNIFSKLELNFESNCVLVSQPMNVELSCHWIVLLWILTTENLAQLPLELNRLKKPIERSMSSYTM